MAFYCGIGHCLASSRSSDGRARRNGLDRAADRRLQQRPVLQREREEQPCDVAFARRERAATNGSARAQASDRASQEEGPRISATQSPPSR